MTCDVLAKAQARLQQIEIDRAALDNEQMEVEAFIRLYHEFNEPQPQAAQTEAGAAPVSKAEATPASVASVAAEEEPHASSADIPSSQGHVETAAVDDDVASRASLAGAEGEADRQPLKTDPDYADPIPATPEPRTFAGKLRAFTQSHPGCTAKEAAKALGTTVTRVWSTAATCPGIELRKLSPEEKANDGRGDGASAGISERIADIRRQHPDWGISQIGRAVDRSPGQVATALKRAGLPTTAVPAKGSSPAPAPTPAPEPERPPALKSEPPAPRISREIVTKPIVRPRGAKFWLKNEAGEFLRFDCQDMTPDKGRAWIGNEQQLAGCRRSFSIARDLREVVVPKETVAA